MARRARIVEVVGALCLVVGLVLGGRAVVVATQGSSSSLTPFPQVGFHSLYDHPDALSTGATYEVGPDETEAQLAAAFGALHAHGVNTVGFYDLATLSDARRDAVFTALRQHDLKAVVRLDGYDSSNFAFDAFDSDHTDAAGVLHIYNSADADGHTALLNYLVSAGRLAEIAYFVVNMPVDDAAVAARFVSTQYPDGRTNPQWAAAQPPYADYLIGALRAVLGVADRAKIYLSVFYGWDQTYPTPSYLGGSNPPDGIVFDNYSYPGDAGSGSAALINRPRLQQAMDRLTSQYPNTPTVVEYGFQTRSNGPTSAHHASVQTAGLVDDVAAKRRALTATAAFYRDGRSHGTPFPLRGLLYFAANLCKREGSSTTGGAPVADWTLSYPQACT